MEYTFTVAALWMGMALMATFLSRRLGITSALMEITVGMLMGCLATTCFGPEALGAGLPWLGFICSAGSIMLTFLAGTEIDPDMMRARWREVFGVGLVSFAAPFFGCAAAARYILGWSVDASWLAGIAMSTTSMAVVYSVMLETGLNMTEYGKGILGACFVTDLGTVLALGIMFAPFGLKTVTFVGVTLVVLGVLPAVTRVLSARYAFRTAAFRTKWVMFVLFGLGALAVWAGSEAVLPAYVVGMVLSRDLGRDEQFIRRLRTMTVGFLSPFYFLRAGSLVSLPALAAAPLAVGVLFTGKMAAKVIGLLPVVKPFRKDRREHWYYTLLMSTGLTFGTISALFGLSHGIVTQEQYSLLVAVVIGSAVIPTVIANAAFLPHHLMHRAEGKAGTSDRRRKDAPGDRRRGGRTTSDIDSRG